MQKLASRRTVGSAATLNSPCHGERQNLQGSMGRQFNWNEVICFILHVQEYTHFTFYMKAALANLNFKLWQQ